MLYEIAIESEYFAGLDYFYLSIYEAAWKRWNEIMVNEGIKAMMTTNFSPNPTALRFQVTKLVAVLRWAWREIIISNWVKLIFSWVDTTNWTWRTRFIIRYVALFIFEVHSNNAASISIGATSWLTFHYLLYKSVNGLQWFVWLNGSRRIAWKQSRRKN